MLKQLLADLAPASLQVPFRFWARRARGRVDPDLYRLLDLVRPGSRAIDVGGNFGMYTYALANRAAVVETFEPLPPCADVLDAFARSRKNIAVHRVALSDREGEAQIHVPYRNGEPLSGWATLEPASGRHETYTVGLRTLDSFEFVNVSAIKIDVEGHELSVLRGALRTIGRERPSLLVEIEQRHHAEPIADVLRQVTALGYEGSFLDERAVEHPLADFNAAQHQDPARADKGDPGYIINFLFRPKAGFHS